MVYSFDQLWKDKDLTQSATANFFWFKRVAYLVIPSQTALLALQSHCSFSPFAREMSCYVSDLNFV
jgi:hypothetical protein